MTEDVPATAHPTGSPPPPGGSIPRWRKVVRVIVVTLAMLGLGEVIARIWLTSPSAQTFDPVLGWVYRPGATVFLSKEGGARLRMSVLGFNDDDPGPKGGRLRLLGFGNSFMEALQVERSENYTTLVESLAAGEGFGETGGPQVDFVNLARSQMGPAHYPVVLSRYGDGLEPDLLVVSVGQGDVVFLTSERVRDERDVSGRLQAVRPETEETDRLKGLLEPALSRSALATYMMRRTKSMVDGWRERWRVYQDGGVAFPLDPSAPEKWRVAAERLAVILAEMRRAAPVLVLDVPHLVYRAGRRVERGAPDESRAYRTAAAAAGVAYLDAGPEMERAFRETGQPCHGFHNAEMGFGHINALGHQAIARAMVAWLRAHAKDLDEPSSSPGR